MTSTRPELVDITVHAPNQHVLDPFQGSIITCTGPDGPYLSQADEHVLLGCDFLWDIVANRQVFDPWCRLTPPVTKLEAVRNFGLAPGVSTFDIGAFPTNRPTIAQPLMMCKDWTFRITLPGKKAVYKIGKFRPSLNCMEASWVN